MVIEICIFVNPSIWARLWKFACGPTYPVKWANLPRCGASWPMFTSLTKVAILRKLCVFYMFFFAETWAERPKFNSGIKFRTMNANNSTVVFKNVNFGPTNPGLPYVILWMLTLLTFRAFASPINFKPRLLPNRRSESHISLDATSVTK